MLLQSSACTNWPHTPKFKSQATKSHRAGSLCFWFCGPTAGSRVTQAGSSIGIERDVERDTGWHRCDTTPRERIEFKDKKNSHTYNTKTCKISKMLIIIYIEKLWSNDKKITESRIGTERSEIPFKNTCCLTFIRACMSCCETNSEAFTVLHQCFTSSKNQPVIASMKK